MTENSDELATLRRSVPDTGRGLWERLAGIVLSLVLLAIGWIVLVTLIPDLPRLASLETEVILMVVLLFASLILVSVVALIHTRR